MEDEEFVEVIQDFYQELLSKQEPLGEEFQQVLVDNWWELLDE